MRNSCAGCSGEQVPFPAGAAIPGYSSFRAQRPDDGVALDEVQITTGIPANMPADLNNNGMADAREIQGFDTLHAPGGTVFRFR
jgi:hypothetical protein